MENSPHLKAVKAKVRTERKRKFTQTSKGEKQTARKKVKEESRARNLVAEIEKAKDGTIVTTHEAAIRNSEAGS
jgi:hypothetical protein